MAEYKKPVTSEVLAKAMGTNPVVVRRVMSGLREQGYVRSEKVMAADGRSLAILAKSRCMTFTTPSANRRCLQ